MLLQRTAAALLVVSSLVWSQTATGRMEGTVTDPAGATVPSAQVSVRDIRRDIVSRATVSADGFFIFPSLPPSVYQLTVEAPGFSKSVVDKIELNVASTVHQDIKLEVGQVTEQVSVVAEAQKVNVSDAQIGRAITMKEIDTLPQLGRNPMALAAFAAPGLSIDPGDNTFSRVNGARQGSNNTTLDGIEANDPVVPRLGLSLTTVNVDSVEEFRVITNGAKAEYGRNAGGQVEMITRSGTNQFHGGVFDYLRNTKLNANTFFNNSSGVARPKFIQNLFGGQGGGRIIRDKTFWYFNYQGGRTAREVVRNRTVPSAELKNGIFRYRSGGEVRSVNLVALDPLRIGIDPFVKKNHLDLLPNPNNADLGDGLNLGGFRFNNPAGASNNQFTFKIDHQLTANHRVFFRQSWFKTYSIDDLNSADATFPGQPQGNQGGIRKAYAIGSNWTLTPTLINEFRLGHQSSSVDFNRPGRPEGPAMISNLWTDPLFTGFRQGRNAPFYNFTNNITKLAGKHTIKGGYTFRRVLQYGFNDAGIYPNISTTRASGNIASYLTAATIPGGSATDLQRLQELYNDLMGRPSQVIVTFYSDLEKFQPAGTGRIRNFLFWDHAAFIQDDIRVNRKLTLNVGLRYELFGPPKETDSLQGTVNRASDLNYTTQINNMSVVKQAAYYNKDRNDFAPRIGFAWNPSGTGKTSIRGAWGMYYDRIIGATTSSVDGATPGFAQSVTTFPNSAAGSDVRISTLPASANPSIPPAPILTPAANRQVTINIFGPNLRTGLVQQMNLTIQREIVRNTVIDVGWVRTRGNKLFNWVDVNQPRIYGDFLNSFRELQAFAVNANSVPSAGNTLVRAFGTPAAAVAGLGGATSFTQGLAGTVADTLDRTNFARYAGAGISDFYLRNYPQWNQVWVGSNVGKSWYDSFQMSVRRTAGALRVFGNYTWSKNLDLLSVEGNGVTNIIDNYNLSLSKGLSDAHRPHTFNVSTIYELPIGKDKFIGGGMPMWAHKIVGGWELGTLTVWQSGSPVTVSSQRRTGPSVLNTWANFNGDRTLGAVERRGDGVYFWPTGTINSFSFPGAGEIGNSGRNTFRRPRYFNTDLSIVKRFGMPWGEKHFVTFRGEMYNLFNNANFDLPATNMLLPATFGKISATVGGARVAQLALRYDF